MDNLHWIGKIDRGDNACILGGPCIQVAHLTEGSTAGFRRMTDIPSVLLLFHCFHSVITVTVTEYLAVQPASTPEN